MSSSATQIHGVEAPAMARWLVPDRKRSLAQAAVEDLAILPRALVDAVDIDRYLDLGRRRRLSPQAKEHRRNLGRLVGRND